MYGGVLGLLRSAYSGFLGVDMIIPCTVEGFKKAQIGDCCVFKSYQSLRSGRENAAHYGVLTKTLQISNTTTGFPYGFEIVYVPEVIKNRYSRAGKTKFNTATIERMKKAIEVLR